MIDLFSFLPADNFPLLPLLICWYLALLLSGIALIFYARFHTLQKEIRQIYLSASTVFFLLGLFGTLLIIFRFNKTPILSIQTLHFIHVPFLVWYIFRLKVKIHNSQKVYERSIKNKSEKESLMKNKDPYLAAHRKKKKT